MNNIFFSQGDPLLLEQQLTFISQLIIRTSHQYTFNIQNEKEIFELFHLIFILISNNKLTSSSLSFLLMLLLNISEKIKNHDIYQSITKDLIEENSPHVYFSVAHGFFILREIISNLKNGDFEINAGKEIQKLVEMFSEDFQKMSPLFLESYNENQIAWAKLNEIINNNNKVNYFILKISNEIENLKSEYLYNKIERKKVLDFIENTIGKNNKKSLINLEFVDECFGIVEGFEKILKIQNIILRINNKNLSILRNYFSIIIIKLVAQIRKFTLNEEKEGFGDFLREVEVYFNHLVNNKNELKDQNNIAQFHLP